MSDPPVNSLEQGSTFAWGLTALIAAHALLLVLASIAFTVVTGERFQIQLFRYSSENGFGNNYQSPDSLPVVVTYIAAYGGGMLAYLVLWGRGWRKLAATGGLLCVAGFLSYSLELTHWFFDHNRSLIVSFPVVSWVLAAGALLLACRSSSDA